MVSTSFMVDTSSHPRAQLHRCVERSAYPRPVAALHFAKSAPVGCGRIRCGTSTPKMARPEAAARKLGRLDN